MKRLSNADKLIIDKLASQGLSSRKIGKILGRGKSTINDYLNAKEAQRTAAPDGVKVLVWDIETAPTLSYHWGRWKVNIGQPNVVQEGYLLTWAAKWLGSDVIMSDSVHLHNTRDELGKPNDYEVCKSIWELLDEADVIVAHNGDRFDLPTVYARLAYHGFAPPHPSKCIDTLKIAKKNFRFPSNRLDALAEYLRVPHQKIKTDFGLWRGCMEGDLDSYESMVEYNNMDVQVLEEVYLKLRAFDKSAPNLSLYNPTGELSCLCGSHNLTPTGRVVTTAVSVFDTHRCNDCGRIVRERNNKLTKEQRAGVLTKAL